MLKTKYSESLTTFIGNLSEEVANIPMVDFKANWSHLSYSQMEERINEYIRESINKSDDVLKGNALKITSFLLDEVRPLDILIKRISSELNIYLFHWMNEDRLTEYLLDIDVVNVIGSSLQGGQPFSDEDILEEARREDKKFLKQFKQEAGVDLLDCFELDYSEQIKIMDKYRTSQEESRINLIQTFPGAME